MTAIVTLTMNPAIDLSSATDHVVPDRKLKSDRVQRAPGGGGINVARAVKRLGGGATAIFTAGGVTGARLAAMVADEGIEAYPIEIEDETRETVSVKERSSGSHFRFVTDGPALQQSECQRVLDAVASLGPPPKYLVASGALPPGVPDDFYGQLSRVAAEHDIRLIVDTSGPALRHAVGPGTYLLKPNLTEVRELMGGTAGAFSDFFLEGAASALVAGGRTHAVIISMGAAGAIVATERGSRRIPAPTVRVENRAGAGDSMVGGIVLALERGASIDEAALFGIAAGSAAVMAPGAELCRREDAERLFDEMKKRVG